jgi:hypothetical protein
VLDGEKEAFEGDLLAQVRLDAFLVVAKERMG